MDKYIGMMLDNRYEILEVMGTGGMAIVYKARCHRLNRLVALKILKEEYAQDADFRRRFHAESQAVAMLSHPNIMSVYDVSRSGPVEYIVMELIDGITLKQYTQKKGVLNWREALHFTTQIVKALSHAHGRGIIHRDIKPHNVMILRDGSVRVADFGIARFTSKQNTLTQEALGSVHYISPEQARGSHIDARADIYSVGVVLYEMVTGRLPYEGDSPVSVAIQHINSMPLTPREINPEIPEALESIIMKAMCSNLDRRYASAEAMLSDLEEFRKNPNISFDYSNEQFSEDSVESEPTQKIVRPDRASIEADRMKQRRSSGDSPGRRRKPASAAPILAAVIAVLMFIGGVVYFLWVFLLSDMFKPSVDLVAPRLIGLKYEDIIRPGEGYDEFEITETERQYSDMYSEGYIVFQSPAESRPVKDGKIIVTVSKGIKTIDLPDFRNVEYREAQRTLQEMGLRYRTPEFETSDELVADQVIRTEPAAYSPVKEGDYITLFVSKGKEVKMTKVPKLEGLAREAALRELEKANLVAGEITPVISDQPAGTIVFQNYAQGEEVEEYTVITMQESLGPPEVTPPPTVEPTPSGPEEKTVTKAIAIPDDRGETVWLIVYVGGNKVFDGVVDASQRIQNVTMTGTGIQTMEIYYDGYRASSMLINFDEE